MGFNENLREYARVIASLGVNATPDRYVLLRCPIEAAELGRLVAEECYKLGAIDVIMQWNDERSARIRLDNASKEQFETVPEWRAESQNYYARKGCVAISIVSEDPDIFAGADSEKLMASALAGKKAFEEFYRIMDEGNLRWTVVAYPNEAWAKKVFPNDTPANAVKKLWAAIFKTVRIGRGDTVKKWWRHDRMLKRRARTLNREKFVSLRYKNSLGTDFTVGLVEGHIWKGGSEKCVSGKVYFPNMPTEEIFTMPHCEKAEGRVYSSMPLSYQGELIDKFYVEFKDGKVVSHGAEVGLRALDRLLNTDEGSRRLGEVALIPYDSPISNLGILFYNTLFDENASCHLALGECYPDTVKGGEKMSKDALRAKGGNNDSANHVDFMIGTADMEIIGIKADGTEVKVFENGNFVI